MLFQDVPMLIADTTAQITISEAAGYAANHFAGDILKVEALFTDNTPGIRVFTIISSDTSGMLTIQEQDLAGNGGDTGYTICEEHWIDGDPGRPSSIIPAITTGSIAHIIMASPSVSGFGEIWNKSIVDFEIFNGELYATIGLNYLYGARVWKTSDGTTWVPNSNFSFGLFHGYYPDGYPSNPTGICWHNTVTARNGNPVCSSFTKFGKSSVTGTETLFTGGTGTGGCNGPGARVARLDTNQWNLIVDYFVDTNTTGTNENGLGNDGYPQAFQFSNFQAWSFAEYDNKLFNAIARFKGGRMMYTANGSTADDAWTYAVGGGASTTEGIGDVTNVGFNLYNYSSSLYAGSFSTVAFLPGFTINGADIWKATGPGNNLTWTRITGNAFGDTKAVEAGAFTEFYGTLYVALSTTLPANFPGEELPGAGGAKIYRLQPQPAAAMDYNENSSQTTTDCTSRATTTSEIPTLIDLSRFDAKGIWRFVILTWKTESEIDNAGFNIYRAETEDGEYVKINASLIPAKGSTTEGASYRYVDQTAKRGTTYYYKLEDVDMSGNATMHGPAAPAPGLFSVFLKNKLQ